MAFIQSVSGVVVMRCSTVHFSPSQNDMVTFSIRGNLNLANTLPPPEMISEVITANLLVHRCGNSIEKNSDTNDNLPVK